MLQKVYLTKIFKCIVIFRNYKPPYLSRNPRPWHLPIEDHLSYRSGLYSGLAHLSEDWKSPEAGSTSSRIGRSRCCRCSRSRWRPGSASRRPLAARGREGQPPAGPGGPPEAGPRLQRVEPRTYVRVHVKRCTYFVSKSKTFFLTTSRNKQLEHSFLFISYYSLE